MIQALRTPRCCGCVPLRLGGGIICLIWAVRLNYNNKRRGHKDSEFYYSFL